MFQTVHIFVIFFIYNGYNVTLSCIYCYNVPLSYIFGYDVMLLLIWQLQMWGSALSISTLSQILPLVLTKKIHRNVRRIQRCTYGILKVRQTWIERCNCFAWLWDWDYVIEAASKNLLKKFCFYFRFTYRDLNLTFSTCNGYVAVFQPTKAHQQRHWGQKLKMRINTVARSSVLKHIIQNHIMMI